MTKVKLISSYLSNIRSRGCFYLMYLICVYCSICWWAS